MKLPILVALNFKGLFPQFFLLEVKKCNYLVFMDFMVLICFDWFNLEINSGNNSPSEAMHFFLVIRGFNMWGILNGHRRMPPVFWSSPSCDGFYYKVQSSQNLLPQWMTFFMGDPLNPFKKKRKVTRVKAKKLLFCSAWELQSKVVNISVKIYLFRERVIKDLFTVLAKNLVQQDGS